LLLCEEEASYLSVPETTCLPLLSSAVFAGPFFSWPAVFLSGEQAAAGFAFINSMGAGGLGGLGADSCSLP